MPVKYIGRTTYYKGKRLFDILCRLKNFGAGRIVYRNVFKDRYAEPSYYVVTKVNPDMSDPTLEEFSKKMKGFAVGKKVFRGDDMGEKRIHAAWKPDWRLVPKDQENEFLNYDRMERPRNIIPDTVPLPPLLHFLAKMDLKEKGLDTNSIPQLNMKINQGVSNRAVLEKEHKLFENFTS